MSRIIQQIHISETKDIYLINFDPITNLLSYRVSTEPSNLITSKVKLEGQKVTVDTYFFNAYFLSKIIEENEERGIL